MKRRPEARVLGPAELQPQEGVMARPWYLTHVTTRLVR